MKRVEKDDVRKQIITICVVVMCVVVVTGCVYFTWLGATTKMSLQFDCEIDEIEYVELYGGGNCMFPVVSGDESMCALPKDIHCSGVVQDFPIVRWISEMGG